MATITSVGGLTVKCVFGKTALLVFPSAPASAQPPLKLQPASKATAGEQGKNNPEGMVSLFSHPDEVPPAGTISWPGEYDFNGISIRGLGHKEGSQVSYVIAAEGVRSAFLSSPLHALSEFEQELIGDIDILVLPVDDVKTVQQLLDVLDPRVFIPLHSKDDKAFQEILKICGAVGKEAVEEYKIKGSLPAEGREVVVLSSSKQ